jgi:hypothetical protein
MKKLVFALCMFGAVVAVNAQDSTSTPSPTDPTSTTPQPAMQDEGRVKIKSQDLPDAVKSSLESQEYRGWLVNSAYKMDAASTTATGTEPSSDSTSVSDSTGVSTQDASSAYNKEVYIVELKNGAQTKTVRFDKDGKKLDDDDMNHDQK